MERIIQKKKTIYTLIKVNTPLRVFLIFYNCKELTKFSPNNNNVSNNELGIQIALEFLLL